MARLFDVQEVSGCSDIKFAFFQGKHAVASLRALQFSRSQLLGHFIVDPAPKQTPKLQNVSF